MTVIINGNLTIDEGKILRTRLAVLHLVHTSAGMPRLIRAYRNYGYGRTSATAMGVPRLQLWAYLGYSYGHTTTAATGVRMGVLR